MMFNPLEKMETMRVFVAVLAFMFYMYYAETKPCKNLLPGLNLLRCGVDVLSLDMMPLEDTASSGGYKKPVLEFSCSKRKKWQLGKVLFDLPDQVWNVMQSASRFEKPHVKFLHKIDDIKKMFASTITTLHPIGLSFFTKSASYETIKEQIKNISKLTAELSSSFPFWKSDFVPYWRFASIQVKAFVDRYLPATLNGTEEMKKYQNFIRYFGTHFFSSGDFGGVIKVIWHTDSSYLEEKSKHTFRRNAHAFLRNFIGGNSKLSSDLQDYADFLEKSTIFARVYGGNTSLLVHDKQLKAWEMSVPFSPRLLGGTLFPTYFLIHNRQKRENAKKTLTIYLELSYLRELRNDIKPYVDWNVVTAVRFQDKIDVLMNQSIPSIEQVRTLASEIKTSLQTPQWLMEDTKFCKKWDFPQNTRNGRKRHNCNTKEKRTECFQLNTFSMKTFISSNQTYGCKRSWKIKSEKHDDFFMKVKLCFRSVTPSLQRCGPRSYPRLDHCQPVNSYTPPFIMNLYSACIQQWKIELPSDAPLWSTRLQFCVQRSSTTSTSLTFCGGKDTKNKFCAKANLWTNYFSFDASSVWKTLKSKKRRYKRFWWGGWRYLFRLFDRKKQKDYGCYLQWGIFFKPDVF